ncbi:MAG: hypothetical protein ACD_46C00228G0001, partial [uncultured bacterium]
MPIINPNKNFIQLPAKQYKVDTNIPIPADWLTELGILVADDILHLEDTQKLYPTDDDPIKREFTKKTEFFYRLNFHAGSIATYSLKTNLLESLQTLYSVLADPKTPFDQKYSLAVKIIEGVPHCTSGFHDRCNECIQGLIQPENLDEMLGVIRQNIVSSTASQITDDVHVYNCFFVIASQYYGVHPLNLRDVYQSTINDEMIKTKLGQAFSLTYTIFNTVNSLVDQLLNMMKLRGYHGKCDDDNGYTYENYSKFNSDYLKPFIGDIRDDQLFICKHKEEDDLVPVIVDINWREVKKALINKLRYEHYFIFAPEENELLDVIIEDRELLPAITPKSLALVPTLNECLHCLTLVSKCSLEKKVAWMLFAYLNNQSTKKRWAIWKIFNELEKIPDLGKDLQAHLKEYQLRNIIQFDIICSTYTFRYALQNLAPDQRTIVYEAVKDQLPNMIQSDQHFIEVLKHLTPDQCASICEAVKDRLPINIIRSMSDLRYVLEDLTPDQCTIVYEAVKDRLFDMIQSMVDFQRALKYLTPDQCTCVCKAVIVKLPNIIQDANVLHYVLQDLTPDQRTSVCEAMKDLLPNIMKNISDYPDLFYSHPLQQTYAQDFIEASQALSQIFDQCRIHPQDEKLIQYVAIQTATVMNVTTIERLKTLTQSIQEIAVIIQSQEVKSVQAYITSLQNPTQEQSALYLSRPASPEKIARSEAIQKALYDMPLTERIHCLSKDTSLTAIIGADQTAKLRQSF